MVINAVMTDDDLAAINAIHTVFGNNIRHLLCIWHVHRSWLKKLRQTVIYEDERTEMYRALCALLSERNENTFKSLCKNFCTLYSQYGDFISYFQQYYLSRPFKWAMCYRNFPHANTNINMYVECFHNRLKTFFMERKPNKRIDDLIDMLLKIEEDDYMRRQRMLLDETEVSYNSSNNESRHTKATKIADNEVTCIVNKNNNNENNNTVWHIKSQSKATTDYTIKQEVTECTNDMCFSRCLELTCLGLCQHLCTCTCPDQNTICKHVHKVHMMMIKQSNKTVTHYSISESIV